MCLKRFFIKCLIDLFGYEKVVVMMRLLELISGMIFYFFLVFLFCGLLVICISVN